MVLSQIASALSTSCIKVLRKGVPHFLQFCMLCITSLFRYSCNLDFPSPTSCSWRCGSIAYHLWPTQREKSSLVMEAGKRSDVKCKLTGTELLEAPLLNLYGIVNECEQATSSIFWSLLAGAFRPPSFFWLVTGIPQAGTATSFEVPKPYPSAYIGVS